MAYVGEGPPVAPMPAEIFTSASATNGSSLSFGETLPTPTPMPNNSSSLSTMEKNDSDFPYVDLSTSSAADNFLLFGEEGQLLKQLIDEFAELKNAADKHIRKMRDFAQDLQTKSRVLEVQQQLDKTTKSSNAVGANSSSNNSTVIDPETPCSEAKLTTCSTEKIIIPSSLLCDKKTFVNNNNNNNWWDQVNEQLDFIDEDDSLVITNEVEKRRLKARSLSLIVLPNNSQQNSNSNSNSTTTPVEMRPSSASAVHRPAAEQPAGGPEAFSKIENDSRCAVVRSGAGKQLREVSNVLDKY